MDQFMQRAVKLAIENVRDGGTPFGAVLVKNKEIISEGVNELHHIFDSSGHAEMLAIRKAQAKLKTLDLSDYTMYASGEPCPMCLSVMYLSGIKQGYYCESVDVAAEIGLGDSKVIYEDLKKDKAARKLYLKQMPLEQGQESPMEIWTEKKSSE
ncbi:nucleoside deaminase [Carnobacterium pleistocenium]|uniref:nucleoside deaminase n=1 Tax=Carnobacterium pleistocenium TaxID=181073 RepID=UPI0005546156|nr:nucleoside deaminase [Carnobacterium pleistocenium]